MSKWAGRQWTSQYKLLGFPLIDIRFADPVDVSPYDVLRTNRSYARGWIALGDRACGLIACGQVAVGGIALGGVSLGAIACGGVGVGLVSMSGLSLGLLSLGGLALGGIALGGLAVGWVAWGGAAFAWRAAQGGLAIAHDFALGGQAIAPHANDNAARAYFEDSSLFNAADRAAQALASISSSAVYLLALAACIIALIAVTLRIAYRRERE
jgi:hypothetical protein